MTKFAGLRPKTYSYLTDGYIEESKAKGTKRCFMKQKLKVEHYQK